MIKNYNNFKIINEKISFEEFCSKTQQIKKMIVEQNKEIIENSQDMMYDILDIIGHIPGLFSLKFGSSDYLALDSKAEEEYFGEIEFDEDEDDKYLKYCLIRMRGVDKINLNLNILYQPACEENDWKPSILTDELEKANISVIESLKSIGVNLEISKSKLNLENKDQDGIWSYTLDIPIKLKMSDSLDNFEVNQNILKSFKEFIKDYNIPIEGEVVISNIIRSIL